MTDGDHSPSSAGAARGSAPPTSAVRPWGSVRQKLMRVVLLTTALALSISGAALLGHELYVYRTSWTIDLSTEAAILAWSTAPALAFDDYAVVERNLRALEVRKRITVAAVYGSDGKIYAQFVRDGEPPPPVAAPHPGIRSAGDEVEFAQPVQRNGEHLGTIYIRTRYDLGARLAAYAGIFGVATLLSMLAAFVLSRRMQRSITAPLDAIANVAHAIVDGRDYSLRATKISDDEIGVVVDAFNKMLEEVQARTRALGDADRRKDEFLATLAHELRNPLAPIRHAVKLLETDHAEERQRRWAREVISRQVQRMALLLDDLLDVSRITQGRLDLKIERVELESLVRAAVETARPLIESKQHHLVIDLPPVALLLAVDPLRLSQALSNLLTNAAKYTDAGGRITLTVALSDGELTLAVSDTGIGLDPQALPQVFEMFSQVESAMTRSEGGLGIGLALVKGLIALHGGRISGYSAGLGTGSRFTIYLPRSVVIDTRERLESSAVGPPIRNGRGKVVVADDNRDAADSLALLLEMNGHSVRVVHCGAEALRRAEEAPPDAMILDIGMPDVTGYDVARQIRAMAWGRKILLIAVTGWGQADDKARANAAGFDHHLTKPVDPEAVEALLQDFLSSDGRMRASAG